MHIPMNIPDRAVDAGYEAAGEAVARYGHAADFPQLSQIVVEAIQAAAPFIVSQAFRDAADMVDGLDADVDYEETTEAAGRRHAAEDLIARADELERP